MPDAATSDLEASLMVCSLNRTRRHVRPGATAAGNTNASDPPRNLWHRTRTANTSCHSRYNSTVSTRAKRVRFFRNGDQYFQGVLYALSRDRCRTFEGLLEDLNRTLGDLVTLPHGVRFIFSLGVGGSRISDLDQFVDGHSYVCSSTEVLKRIDYESARQP
ncbi:unnamed protein product, partial [Soboliphyme baturini]|uniref:Doublecortin domain-containing protein n=1 Tax=Soboliphyme baturini TaxID=241478 RepID=A0A183IGT9_9BILA